MFKVFIDLYGKNNYGYEFAVSGFTIGLTFNTYMGYIEDDLSKMSDEVLAINILSLILLSDNTTLSVIEIYRNNISKYVPELNRISKLEVHILSMHSKVSEHYTANKAMK
jgi:uncharacterized radical SAM superfamily protein